MSAFLSGNPTFALSPIMGMKRFSVLLWIFYTFEVAKLRCLRTAQVGKAVRIILHVRMLIARADVAVVLMGTEIWNMESKTSHIQFSGVRFFSASIIPLILSCWNTSCNVFLKVPESESLLHSNMLFPLPSWGLSFLLPQILINGRFLYVEGTGWRWNHAQRHAFASGLHRWSLASSCRMPRRNSRRYDHVGEQRDHPWGSMMP